MLRKYPLISRLTLFVLLPCLIAAALGYRHLRRSLPPTEAQTVAAPVSREVRVVRDEHGVPSIVAGSDRDAFFAMGYVQAQDRMWQLEVQRRIASGRLSEVLGKDTIDQDIWFRTLGLTRSAQQAWQALSPQARDSLQAYTDGINHWLASRPVLPVEFSILRIEPEPWTVYDSLAWAKVFALNLGGNHRRELERLLVGDALPPAKLQALFPDYGTDANASLASLAPDQRAGYARYLQFQQRIESRLQIGGRYVGSNAWVVSSKLTGDGSALLANDPHLGLQIPSLWYMASIKGDRIDAQGACMVGLPMVIFGRNRNIAWGGTNLMADVQDLYLEQVRADDKSRYAVNGEWRAFYSREELIQVRQKFPQALRNPLKPLRVRVRSSRHGPIVSDVYRVFDQPAALRWAALDPDDTSYDAFLALNYASDWASFQEALRPHVAPAMNLVYADRGGNIGYIAAGRIPVRASGDGSVPVPGWDDSHAWTGTIPFAQWPRNYNPDSGYLVTANNKPVDADYPYLITRDWAPPARAHRIAALLGGGGKLDLDAMRGIQADIRSEPARRLLPRLLRHQPSNDAQRQAYTYLKSWQGDMGRDSQAATIFNAWTRQLKRKLLADELESYWNKRGEGGYLGGVADGIDLDSLGGMLVEGRGSWCDDSVSAQRIETCDEVLNSSLDEALRELRKIDRDPSMKSWAWGELHETHYRHMPFSEVNVLRSLFGRRIGNGGSPDSINVASFGLEKSRGYTQEFGAGFRQLVALSPDRIEHRYMNSTGQSGNVASAHYDDMIEPFRNVEYYPLAAPSTAASATGSPAGAAADHTLVLTPGQPGARR